MIHRLNLRKLPVTTRRERVLIKNIFDLAAINFISLWIAKTESHFSVEKRFLWIGVTSLCWLVGSGIIEFNDRPVRKLDRQFFGKSLIVSCIFGLEILLLSIYFEPLTSNQTRLYFVAPFIYLVISRTIMKLILKGVNVERKILIVGDGPLTEELQTSFKTGLGQFKVVGQLLRTSSMPHEAIWKHLGNIDSLKEVILREEPHEIIVAIDSTDLDSRPLFDALSLAREKGVHISTATSMIERISGRVPIHDAWRDLYSLVPSQQHNLVKLGQRLFDLIFGIIGGLLTLPFIPLVWIANRLSNDPGPLFYSQERTGLYGKSFMIHKFRSMRVDAEKGGAVWASTNDSRITAVGNLLRKSRIDELPQFLNVIQGDMSIIGPRPERPQFVEQLAEQIPFYRARHAVKPGLTGWAQVRYRYGASVEDARIKLEYDLYYIKHQGVLLNIRICLRTIGVILGLKGR